MEPGSRLDPLKEPYVQVSPHTARSFIKSGLPISIYERT